MSEQKQTKVVSDNGVGFTESNTDVVIVVPSNAITGLLR